MAEQEQTRIPRRKFLEKAGILLGAVAGAIAGEELLSGNKKGEGFVNIPESNKQVDGIVLEHIRRALQNTIDTSADPEFFNTVFSNMDSNRHDLANQHIDPHHSGSSATYYYYHDGDKTRNQCDFYVTITNERRILSDGFLYNGRGTVVNVFLNADGNITRGREDSRLHSVEEAKTACDKLFARSSKQLRGLPWRKKWDKYERTNFVDRIKPSISQWVATDSINVSVYEPINRHRIPKLPTPRNNTPNSQK